MCKKKKVELVAAEAVAFSSCSTRSAGIAEER